MDGINKRINKKYNIEIEVLTPLSIGAGQEKDWVRGVDFIVDNGLLYKLNLKKMVANGVNISDITNCFATKNEGVLKSKLAGKLDAVSDFAMPFPANTDNDVKAFVKNQLNGKPVLTGSSLKGAIRSVLFQYLKGNSKDGKEVFGSSTAGDEFMRFIKISDAEFDKTELVNTKIFNLQKKGDWIGGWKHGATLTDSIFKPTGFNTLYESLVPQQKGYASLMMSEKLYNLFETEQRAHIKSAEKRPILHNNIQKLFEIINKHTKNYLRKEKAFFEEFETDKTDDILDSIEELLKQIPSDNSYCILKMSAGSGFHSITGDWQFDDYTKAPLDRKRVREGKVNPKSRKIAVLKNQLSLMGFVKLTAKTEEQLKQEEAERAKQEEAKRQVAIEAERQQKEVEEKAKREKERYEQLMNEGKQLAEQTEYEKALACYKEAQAISDNTEIQHLIADVDLKLSIIANQKHEEEARQKANAVPLAEKIANAQKLPTLYGNVKQWMKQNGRDSLTDEEINALRNQIERIVNTMKTRDKQKMKNLGSELESFISSDLAQCWFNEIVTP